MSDSGAGECEKSDEKTDPGAIRHGNFMNYYQFHPAEERVRQLPRGVWQRQRVAHPARKYAGLDVGCNAGVRAAARRHSCRGRMGQPKTGWLGLRDPKLQTAASNFGLSPFQLFARAAGIRFRNSYPLSLLKTSCTCPLSRSSSLKLIHFLNYTEWLTTVMFPLSWRLLG